MIEIPTNSNLLVSIYYFADMHFPHLEFATNAWQLKLSNSFSFRWCTNTCNCYLRTYVFIIKPTQWSSIPFSKLAMVKVELERVTFTDVGREAYIHSKYMYMCMSVCYT